MTESITRNASGKIIQSVTTRRRAVSLAETVSETRGLGKNGELQLVGRTTERTDLTGGSLTIKEKRLGDSPGLTITYLRSIIVAPDGNATTIEKGLNKNQALLMTHRVTTGGTCADRLTLDERWDLTGVLQSVSKSRTFSKRDADGSQVSVSTRQQETRSKAGVMEIVLRSETETRREPDGTRIVVVSNRDKDGHMVPVTRSTTNKDIDGSMLTVSEKRGADGAWITTTERSTVNTHVSGMKIPKVNRNNKANYGPQK